MSYILGYNQLSNSAAWPPMNRRTCVPARQHQHLHVPYQICYHFLKNTKKYRRGDARQNPPEIPGANTPSAVQLYVRSTIRAGIDLSTTRWLNVVLINPRLNSFHFPACWCMQQPLMRATRRTY
jgi:hypothetical protein